MTQLSYTYDFVEKSEEGFENKSENFCNKIVNYGENAPLTPERIEWITGILEDVSKARQEKISKRMAAKASTLQYNNSRKLAEKAIRQIKKEIEANPKCTPQMLEELGLNNSKKIIDSDDQAPVLKVKMVAGVPQIRYNKMPFDGIRLFCRINNGASDYQETVTMPYFNDSRPRLEASQPETREYYAYYIKKGQILGQQSETVKITLPAVL